MLTSENKTIQSSDTSNRNVPGKAPFFQPKLTINAPGDEYEQEADAMADKVMRMPMNDQPFFSAKPVGISHLQRKCAHCEEEEKLQRKENTTQPTEAGSETSSYIHSLSSKGSPLSKETRSFFEPRFGYDFSDVKVHTDAVAAKSAHGINALAYTSGNNIVFNENQFSPESDSGKKLLAHELMHVVQQGAKGNNNSFEGKGEMLLRKPDTKPGSEIDAAEAELDRIETLRTGGKEIDPAQEFAAQQKARIAAQNAIARGGGEIQQIISSVSLDISKIENARYRGYQQALIDLNLTQLDEKQQEGDVASFALSLAGNLLWALSGLIALTPVGEFALAALVIEKGGLQLTKEAGDLIAASVKTAHAAHMAKIATAAGVGGAMLAQFSNGLPRGASGGGNVSGPLIQLEAVLNKVNADLFNTMTRSLYPTLLRLVAATIAPRDKSFDAQKYSGALEVGVRNILFEGYYQNGGASGSQVNPDVIQQDARNQLLRRLVVSSGKISGEGIVSTEIDKQGVGKLTQSAVSLIGGAKALVLGDYELVNEQLDRVVRELGLKVPNVNSDLLREDFRTSDILVYSAYVTDGGIKVNNSAQVEFVTSGVHPQITDVVSIEIHKKDLRSAKIGDQGALVYSADKFWIHAHGYLGGMEMEDEYEQIQQGPVPMLLTYKV